jgi:hypothetical protein
MSLPLNNNDREALIIRWRTILRLALLDYFDVTHDYSRIAVKEILDLEQAVVKSSCRANGITVPERGFPNRLVEEICGKFTNGSSEELRKLHRELDSLRETFRNPETHTLSLPMPPPETVRRCLRKFKHLIEIIDPELYEYARGEAIGFLRLRYFYYEIVGRERTSYRDEMHSKLLVELKRRNDEVEVKTERGSSQHGMLINEERSPYATVKLIEKGQLDSPEFNGFVEAALSIGGPEG